MVMVKGSHEAREGPVTLYDCVLWHMYSDCAMWELDSDWKLDKPLTTMGFCARLGQHICEYKAKYRNHLGNSRFAGALNIQ